MIQTKRYTRGAHTYEMRQLGGKLAAKLSIVVLNAVGDVAPALLAIKKGGLGDLDVSKLSLDWSKVEPLLDAFAEHTMVVSGGQTAQLHEVFDYHFAGDLDGMTELISQGLVLNYASFLEQRFGVSLKQLAENWEKAKSKPSPSESPTD